MGKILFFIGLYGGLDREEVAAAPSPCTRYIHTVCEELNIPIAVLWSILYTESGRSDEPWPWSANVSGRSYYFQSRKALVRFAQQKNRKNPRVSMDIGCMQLNTLYHGHKFKSLKEMTNVKKNIWIGALYLRELYEKYHTIARQQIDVPFSVFSDHALWARAVGEYHSRSPRHAHRYLQKAIKGVKQWASMQDILLPTKE